jgi:hypothetical protein
MWAACTGRQGRFPLECGPDLLRYCSWLSKVKSPSLLRFAVLAVLRQLPTPGRFFRRHEISKQLELGTCPLCHAGAVADSEHAITCPWLGSLRGGTASSVMAVADPGSVQLAASLYPMSRVVRSWANQVCPPGHVSSGRAEMCASWFLENNPEGSQQQFSDAFDAIARSQARSSVPDQMLDVLREEFSLMVQVGASAACRTPAFPRWFS